MISKNKSKQKKHVSPKATTHTTSLFNTSKSVGEHRGRENVLRRLAAAETPSSCLQPFPRSERGLGAGGVGPLLLLQIPFLTGFSLLGVSLCKFQCKSVAMSHSFLPNPVCHCPSWSLSPPHFSRSGYFKGARVSFSSCTEMGRSISQP